ncbi:hypothetical protein [Neolewinella agarilytica]|uniref:hypothetical protein n=1 Tax=Neolewinella agarilytica TaxID=478744 RepID=UPI002356F29D|nr:hypothetical protein [Neolewinella agarilytica]
MDFFKRFKAVWKFIRTGEKTFYDLNGEEIDRRIVDFIKAQKDEKPDASVPSYSIDEAPKDKGMPLSPMVLAVYRAFDGWDQEEFIKSMVVQLSEFVLEWSDIIEEMPEKRPVWNIDLEYSLQQSPVTGSFFGSFKSSPDEKDSYEEAGRTMDMSDDFYAVSEVHLPFLDFLFQLEEAVIEDEKWRRVTYRDNDAVPGYTTLANNILSSGYLALEKSISIIQERGVFNSPGYAQDLRFTVGEHDCDKSILFILNVNG